MQLTAVLQEWGVMQADIIVKRQNDVHKISTSGITQQGSGACCYIELTDSKTKIHEAMMSLHVKGYSVKAYMCILTKELRVQKQKCDC